MTRPKNPRGRNNTAPKIDKLLSMPPQANRVAEARAASASNMSAASNTEGNNSDILNEIRNMNQGLQQRIQKVGDDVTTIKVSLESLKADIAKLGSRTSESEARISQLEDENAQLVNISQSMENKITQLQARLEYQENYSRRNNIRRPRHMLVRFLRFTDREKVRLRAKELGAISVEGQQGFFFLDFSKEVQDKRNKFTEVRSMCMKLGGEKAPV